MRRRPPVAADHVVVVGAGLGGLAAALHLAGAGRTVTVLERAEQPGGLAAGHERAGYRFDSGPTVLTMPELLTETFAAVGASCPVTLTRLDPAYQARFADGSTIAVRADVAAMTAEIEATCGPGDADGYRRLVARLRALYALEAPHFIGRNLDSVRDLAPAALVRLIGLGGARRWSALVASFLRDPRLQRLFSFQALYAGLAPQRALASYAVIAYMDCVAGVYYPQGGFAALARALADAATRHGVRIRYGCPAVGFELAGDRIRAVRTAQGPAVPADAVVWNGPVAAADALLARPPAPVHYAPSCLVWHTGTPATAATAHHTISFGAPWAQTFVELTRTGQPTTDPSLLISTPTLSDPHTAPAGRHAHYVLLPLPNRDRGRPDADREVDRVRTVLASRGLDACVADAEVEIVRTPADWAAAGYPAGTPFGPDHRMRQTGPLRRPTRDRRLANLLFCGAATQPGVGVPSVLVSGRLAAERIVGARRGG